MWGCTFYSGQAGHCGKHTGDCLSDCYSYNMFTLQLPETDELTWDDGSATPEPCLDIVAPTVTKVVFSAHFSLYIEFPMHCSG